MQDLIQINVDGQEVVGAIKQGPSNQMDVEILSPYSGHRASTYTPISKYGSNIPLGIRHLMRDLLEDLYLQCRWDPTS